MPAISACLNITPKNWQTVRVFYLLGYQPALSSYLYYPHSEVSPTQLPAEPQSSHRKTFLFVELSYSGGGGVFEPIFITKEPHWEGDRAFFFVHSFIFAFAPP